MDKDLGESKFVVAKACNDDGRRHDCGTAGIALQPMSRNLFEYVQSGISTCNFIYIYINLEFRLAISYIYIYIHTYLSYIRNQMSLGILLKG